jgi:hypothetical protein
MIAASAEGIYWHMCQPCLPITSPCLILSLHPSRVWLHLPLPLHLALVVDGGANVIVRKPCGYVVSLLSHHRSFISIYVTTSTSFISCPTSFPSPTPSDWLWLTNSYSSLCSNVFGCHGCVLVSPSHLHTSSLFTRNTYITLTFF